jgi:hypothetical protein
MAVTGQWAPPPTGTRRAIKRAMRTAELAPAGELAQLAVYLEIALALGLAAAFVDSGVAFGATAAALGAGIAIGIITPLGRWFTDVSGVVAAIVAMFVVFLGLAFTDGGVFDEEGWLIPLVVGLGVLGLDWGFVPRLRARAVTSGVLVVPLIGADRNWAYAGAIVWFIGLLLTLWLLERDARRAALRPIPLRSELPPSRTNAMDFVRTAALGLAVGLLGALLLSDVTCSPRLGEVSTPTLRAPSGLDRSGTEAFRSLLPPSPKPGGQGLAGELEYSVDQNGRLVVRDAEGSTFTYDRDAEGRNRVRVEDSGETRIYVYDESGDGTTVTEYDEDGRKVGEYAFDSEADVGERGASGGINSPSSNAPTGPTPDDASDSGGMPWVAIIGVTLGLAALVALAVWLLHKRIGSRRELSWAEQLAERLDDEGRRRGRGRPTSETVVDHARALAGGPLPDSRIPAVGRLVSAALFGRTAPPADAQTWAESVVDEATAAHPAGKRSRP